MVNKNIACMNNNNILTTINEEEEEAALIHTYIHIQTHAYVYV